MNESKVFLHISPFLWTMGEKKGIFSILAYKYMENHGYEQFFVVPNVNIFDGRASTGEQLPKEEGVHGIVFDVHRSMVVLFSHCVGRTGILPSLGKSFWFCYYMLKSFFVAFRAGVRFGRQKIRCIYAHTWITLFPALIISKLLRIALIYRVYGIHNYEIALRGSRVRALLKPDILAFKVPFELCVITNDGTLGDAVAISMGVPKDKILFLLNGLDNHFFIVGSQKDALAKLMRERLQISSTKKVILYVGRLVEWKRIDRILYVLHYLKERICRTDVCAVIAGDGYQKPYLQQLARSLGIEKEVIFLGGVMRSELIDVFSVADLYLTLQDLTNLSNSLVEAMAVGVCVVAGDVGGTRSFVNNMRNGVLVPSSNLEDVAKVVDRTLSDDEKRFTLAKASQEFVRNIISTWKQRMDCELNAVNVQLMKQKDNRR